MVFVYRLGFETWRPAYNQLGITRGTKICYNFPMQLFLLAVALTLNLATFTFAAGKTTAATAIFAGGCFWCMEPPFKALEGVTSVRSGYTGGKTENPTYEQVSSGATGHFEAVEVTYDPKKITYEKLLETFWRNIDPLDDAGQFCDKGSQYKTAVFYANETEKKAATASLDALKKGTLKGKTIYTQILPAAKFYPAEGYHQEYYLKQRLQYQAYRLGCGRDKRLQKVWGTAPAH